MTRHEEGDCGGLRAWLAWVAASLCLLFQFMVQVQPSAMIGSLEASFHVDAVQLGGLTSAYFITYVTLQIPIGWLIDRVGPRAVLLISMVLTMLGLIWFGYATSLGWATMARVGLGIAGAPAFPAAALVASRWFAPSRFALMLGLTEAFTMLGGVIMDMGLPRLEPMLDRGGSGLVLAGVAAALAVVCWVFIRDQPAGSKKLRPAQAVAGEAEESIFRVLIDVRIWLAGVHAGLFFAVIAAFGGLWVVPFLHARLDVAPETATYLASVLFLGGAVGAPLLGVISGRGRWRGPTLIVASVACAGLGGALVYAPGGMVVVLVLLGLLGFFSGVFAVDLACIRDVVSPARRGLAMGAGNMLLGVIGGPLMLMAISKALDLSSGEGFLEPMAATIEQMRLALAWFVGALVLTIPLGLLLVYVMRPNARRREPIR